jgi:hypothetical protein
VSVFLCPKVSPGYFLFSESFLGRCSRHTTDRV